MLYSDNFRYSFLLFSSSIYSISESALLAAGTCWKDPSSIWSLRGLATRKLNPKCPRDIHTHTLPTRQSWRYAKTEDVWKHAKGHEDTTNLKDLWQVCNSDYCAQRAMTGISPRFLQILKGVVHCHRCSDAIGFTKSSVQFTEVHDDSAFWCLLYFIVKDCRNINVWLINASDDRVWERCCCCLELKCLAVSELLDSWIFKTQLKFNIR